MYTSAEDPLKRHLRPLHLEKQWSSSIKYLSQRGGQLRALVCGPKAAGKSTFSRYLLNHLLSPAPQTEGNYSNTDGVAFLDLDPGQPEFSPMGQVYLAHLRSPFFGPPFTHPSLDNSVDGYVIRSHHIGSTSPKEDPDHYVLAAMDLMDRYRSLLATYPQCPLIINYPGWIFGLGLEVVTWLVKSLGLSDVVYMSEKGPAEVVEPLGQAAYEARIPLITLPSQPTDFTSRSSAQLRSMQIQSYFHKTHAEAVQNPMWLNMPISRARPMLVDYAGPRQGIRGIMVMGSQIHPDLLHDVLDGSIVGVVAVESPNAIMGEAEAPEPADAAEDEHESSDIGTDPSSERPPTNPTSTSNARTSMEAYVTRTAREGLPYLFVGSGSCSPLDPKASYSLGLALVRSIQTEARKLELVTPVPGGQIRQALEQGHGIVLVRGPLDNPNWAISEEYYAARAAAQRHRLTLARKSKHADDQDGDKDDDSDENEAEDGMDMKQAEQMKDKLQESVRRASQVPWMQVEDDGRRQREVARSLWKLRKRARPDESE